MRAMLLGMAVVVLAACNPDTPAPAGPASPAPGAVDDGTASGSVWSPDRADLIFMSNREGNAEIYLLGAGVAEWRNLTDHPAQDNWPEWSPDGTRIAFQSDRAGNLDIWVMDADGSNPVQLTDDPADDYLPAWSPDGRRLSFASWRQEPGDGSEAAVHHYAMDADGSNQTRLFADSPGISTAAVWAPDGESFLVAMKASDGQGADIYRLSAEGTVLQRFTEDAPTDGAPAYSPDGSQIVFHADGGESSALVILDADGTNRRTLLPDGQQWYPRWSPDGRWLVFTSANPIGSDDLDVMAIPADGASEALALADGPTREAEGRWRPRPPDTTR